MEQTQSLTLVDMFNYQGNKLRHIIIDDEIWWPATDICAILGIANVSKAVEKLGENECITLTLSEGIRGNPNKNFVNEPGLYRLIFRSDKPEAKQFQDWVYHEVLPTIRKTGGYGNPLRGLVDLDALDQAIAKLKTIKRLNRPPVNRIAQPRVNPQETLEQAIMRHAVRLNRPSAADLHNYIKRYPASEIRATLETLVNRGDMYRVITSHTVRYQLV